MKQTVVGLTVIFYFEKIGRMQLYHILNGAYLGFYQEAGGTVFISGYRKVKGRQWVCSMVTEEYKRPDEIKMELITIEEHEELREFTVPEHEETLKRIVPEHYESKTETTPAHWGTREYWLEPHIEIQYRFVGTEEQRSGRYGWELVDDEWVFVGTEEQRAGRVGWEAYEVEIPGCWEERRVWYPEVTRTYDVLVPEHEEEYTVVILERKETKMVTVPYSSEWRHILVTYEPEEITHEVCGWEDVEVEQPIYSYYSEYDEYELTERVRGPVMVIVGEPVGDMLTLKVLATGQEIEVEAKYVGLAQQIDSNKFVAPEEE